MINYQKIGGALHSSKYRPDIDGLRAIAVSSVVICHAFPDILPGGFVGVDIFFVISGYLISSILIKELDRNAFSILGFYNRRIRRIFPALIATLLFVAAFGWFCLFTPEFQALGRHICAASLFSENVLLWNEAGYFDVLSKYKPTLHLWSLAIEEQFYIFWPILMYIAHRWRINFILMFAVLAGASFILNIHEIHTNPVAAYYSPFGRSWELMIGACLAYTQTHRPELIARFKNVQSFAGLLMIAMALILVRPADAFPGYWALLPTIGSALLLSSGENGWVNRKLLSMAPMVWCGLISYPLYLWHWPFLSFGYINFGLPLPHVKALMCIVAAVIAAVFTFLYVERPFRGKVEGPGKTFGLLGVMVGTLACGLLIAALVPPRLKGFDAPTRNEWTFLQQRTPGFNNSGVGIYPLEAHRQNLVLVIGDSHMAQYAERLDKTIVADPARPGAVLAIGGGCIPIENVKNDDLQFSSCWPMRNQAYAMAEQPKYMTIVIGGAWNWYFLSPASHYYTRDASGQRIALTSSQGRQLALQTLGGEVSTLVHSGKHVIFVLDNPTSPAMNSESAATRLGFSEKNFRRNLKTRVGANEIALKQQLTDWAKSQGASVIDPFDAVCTGNVCGVTTGTGQPMYRDEGHFNPDWAVGNARFIDAAVSN